MPREKRAKFADRWRHIGESAIADSVAHEFESAGINVLRHFNISQKIDYSFCFEKAYKI